MLSFEMQCDQEFGLFRSPFSSEWWPEVSVRLRSPASEPDLAKAERNFENGNGKPVAPIVSPEGMALCAGRRNRHRKNWALVRRAIDGREAEGDDRTAIAVPGRSDPRGRHAGP